MDEQDLIWGGEDTPCAICSVCSLGGINKANNTALSGELTALMSEFKVTPDRMYTNFWDIGQRENCGYNGVTFAEVWDDDGPPGEGGGMGWGWVHHEKEVKCCEFLFVQQNRTPPTRHVISPLSFPPPPPLLPAKSR